MDKKWLELELVYDIPTLITLQEYALKNMRRTIPKQEVIDFQEDILRILKMVEKIPFIRINEN